MYSAFFAPRYFAPHYFSHAVPSEASYFPHGYFPETYYADRYFPGADAPISQPKYFYHGFFAARFFADRYFPGAAAAVVEPPPTPPPTQVGAGVGGPPPQIYIPVIHGVADLIIPTPFVEGLGFATPASVRAALNAQLQAFTIGVDWQSRADPQPIGVLATFWLPSLDVSGIGLYRRPTSRPDDEDEERILMEHYLMTLQMVTQRGRKS